jgi:regulatory protein
MPKRVPSEQPAFKKKASPKTAPSVPAKPSAPDLSPDTCAVLSVTPAGEGETVTVVLALPDPEGKRAQRVSFRLLVEQYAELGVKAGEITPEEADTLLDAGKLCGAIRRGISLLGYGDQSARRLAYKLTAKGVDRDTAARATAYLTEKGYIREDDTAVLRAEQDLRKGWGERRIREDLIAHGFTREAVEEAMEELSNTDWVETCAAAIRKKYGEIPEDKGERQKMLTAMMRLGYDTDTVKAAARNILREK